MGSSNVYEVITAICSIVIAIATIALLARS